MMPKQRIAILGNQYWWNISIPYELSVNRSMNYKGIILRSFEQFRLKSCIDFKPRATEDISYISVESRDGCWSYVGRTYLGGQALFIGNGCGTKAIVEHEFLHALGFWHEQSRYDRDDYVTINFANIITGLEHNFNKYSENMSTTQDTPYDYYSVMHYDKNAFSNGNGSTIITKHPEFQGSTSVSEYQNEAHSRGTLRLTDQITGPPGNCWKLHHVPLNANKTFQVVFEARKGAGNSSGGFSLDDINISETECPHTWQIRDFGRVLNNNVSGTWMYSPLFYSSDGYRFQAGLRLYQNYLSIYVRLVSGAYDDQLQWPCPWRQITFQMLDQNPHIQKHMSPEKSITTDPTWASSNGTYYWDSPRSYQSKDVIGNESVFVGTWIYSHYIRKADLTRREFIKGGDISLQHASDCLGIFCTSSTSAFILLMVCFHLLEK